MKMSDHKSSLTLKELRDVSLPNLRDGCILVTDDDGVMRGLSILTEYYNLRVEVKSIEEERKNNP